MIEDAEVSALLARLRGGKYADMDAWRARVERFGGPELRGVGMSAPGCTAVSPVTLAAGVLGVSVEEWLQYGEASPDRAAEVELAVLASWREWSRRRPGPGTRRRPVGKLKTSRG